MKKKLFYLVLSLSLANVCYVFNSFESESLASALQEETNDLVNEKFDVNKLALNQLSASTVSMSKTYTQYGVADDGRYMIRFATAIKGDIESLSYFRSIDTGEYVEKPIANIYEGIIASNESGEQVPYYYDGTGLTVDASYKGQYYWACYTVRFSDETKWDWNVNAYVSIKETNVEEKITSATVTTSVNSEIEKSKPKLPEEYVGNIYKDDSMTLKITGVSSATVEYSSYNGTYVVDASLAKRVDINGDVTYTFTNADGERFEVLIYNKTAHLSKVKYLDNGELKEVGGTSYCELQVFMTSFNIKVGSLSANSEGKYEVLSGESVYVTVSSVYPSESNNKEVVYSSLDTSIATVDGRGKVSFVGSGEVTIRVTSAYDEKVYKEATFVVTNKVYPNDINWSISAEKESIYVGSETRITITLDESINTIENPRLDYTIQTSDKKIATASRDGMQVVVKGIKAGTVTISISYQGETGLITKEVVITVEDAPLDEVVPGVVQGTWSGYDDFGTAFTFTVNADGTAVLENDYGIYYEFTFNRLSNGEYFFALNSDSSVEVGIYLANSQFYLYDTNGTINDYSLFGMWSEYVDITK